MAEPTAIEWTGGEYPDREGITVTADADGVTVSGWYDGGPMLEVVGTLTWEELDRLRAAAQHGSPEDGA